MNLDNDTAPVLGARFCDNAFDVRYSARSSRKRRNALHEEIGRTN